MTETALDTEKEDFLNELTLMSNIPKHFNIVTYYGCCLHDGKALSALIIK